VKKQIEVALVGATVQLLDQCFVLRLGLADLKAINRAVVRGRLSIESIRLSLQPAASGVIVSRCSRR
jgi:hypothetical protein